jgi:hypothetical protein
MLGQPAFPNGLNVSRLLSSLECQRCMERDGPRTLIGYRVGQQQCLYLVFRELPPWTFWNRPTRLLISTGDVDMEPRIFGIMPKMACNCTKTGLERSGAESMVLTGNSVIFAYPPKGEVNGPWAHHPVTRSTTQIDPRRNGSNYIRGNQVQKKMC